MKKIIFALLISISIMSCSKIEDAINKRIDNLKDSLANEISLKRPSDEFCNPMSKTQEQSAKMIDDSTFVGEFAGEFSIYIKLKNEEAELVTISSNSNSTQKAKTQKQFMFPNSIWIGKTWVPITILGDGKKCIFEEKIDFSKMIIPENYTKIQANAMRGLSSIEMITFPSTLVSIGESAFEDCSNIKTLKFSDNLTQIANAFKGCNSLTDISFANTPNNPLIILQLLKNFVDEQLSKITIKIPEEIVEIVVKAIKEDEVLSQKIDKIAGIQIITPEPSPSLPNQEEEIIKCTSIEIDENIELPFNKNLEVKTLPENHQDELSCQIIAGEGDLTFNNGQINSGTTDGIYIVVFTCGDVVKTSRIFVNKNYGKTFATGISAPSNQHLFAYEVFDFPEVTLSPKGSIIDENSLELSFNDLDGQNKIVVDNQNKKIHVNTYYLGQYALTVDIKAKANGQELTYDKYSISNNRLFKAMDNNFVFLDRSTNSYKDYIINFGFISKDADSPITQDCNYYLHLDFDDQYIGEDGKTTLGFGEYNPINETFAFPTCIQDFDYEIVDGQNVASVEVYNNMGTTFTEDKLQKLYLQVKVISKEVSGTIHFNITFKINNHFIKMPFSLTYN